MRHPFLQSVAAAGLVCNAVAPATAQTTTLTGAKFEAISNAGKPCPRSSYNPQRTSGESLGLILTGLLSTFVDKGFDIFAKWLEDRKERLKGDRSARLTDEFWNDNGPKATCFVFTAGEFGSDGSVISPNVYLEFAPVFLDRNDAFTLKPVYLQYDRTVAQAHSKDGKFASFAVTWKFNAPVAAGDGKTAATLKDGGGFSYAFGKLREGTRLDYRALAMFDGGLAFTPPKIKDGQSLIPVAYEMSGVWAESAEPSPLYNAFVATVKENKAKITPEVAATLRQLLGLPEPAK